MHFFPKAYCSGRHRPGRLLTSASALEGTVPRRCLAWRLARAPLLPQPLWPDAVLQLTGLAQQEGEDDGSPGKPSLRDRPQGHLPEKVKVNGFVVAFFPFNAHFRRESEEGKMGKIGCPCLTPLTLPASCSSQERSFLHELDNHLNLTEVYW